MYGREAPGLAELEIISETQLEDASAGSAGHSWHDHRLCEMAIAAMIQETAQMRLERALDDKQASSPIRYFPFPYLIL